MVSDKTEILFATGNRHKIEEAKEIFLQLENNKKRPIKKSKFQARLEEMAKKQQEATKKRKK